MKNRPYVTDEVHEAVKKYAAKRNITNKKAYEDIIKRHIDANGNLINEIEPGLQLLLEQAKQKMSLYLGSSKCKWCKAKAEIFINAVNELIELDKSAQDFVDKFNNSQYINQIGAETHDKN